MPATGKITCPTARQEEVQVGQHRRIQVVKGLVTVTKRGQPVTSGGRDRVRGHKGKGNVTKCRGHKGNEIASQS